MMETTNLNKPLNRAFAVVDGGLNYKPGTEMPAAKQPKLLEQVRQAIRTRHYSARTEKAYVHWIKRYIFFHSKRHPLEMGEAEVGRFLSALAIELRVSASTQNQALNALLFLYKEVLHKQIGFVDGVVRAKRPHRLPVVLTRQEVRSIVERLQGSYWLIAMLLYGAGLRLMECLRLRVKDIDLTRNQIVVRAGKGDKDRRTMLPAAVKEPLAKHLDVIKRLYHRDLECGLGRVTLPNALERKYPNAGKELGMAMAVSSNQSFHGQSNRRKTPTSSARIGITEGGKRSGARIRRG
jgi:integron integrase